MADPHPTVRARASGYVKAPFVYAKQNPGQTVVFFVALAVIATFAALGASHVGSGVVVGAGHLDRLFTLTALGLGGAYLAGKLITPLLKRTQSDGWCDSDSKRMILTGLIIAGIAASYFGMVGVGPGVVPVVLKYGGMTMGGSALFTSLLLAAGGKHDRRKMNQLLHEKLADEAVPVEENRLRLQNAKTAGRLTEKQVTRLRTNLCENRRIGRQPFDQVFAPEGLRARIEDELELTESSKEASSAASLVASYSYSGSDSGVRSGSRSKGKGAAVSNTARDSASASDGARSRDAGNLQLAALKRYRPRFTKLITKYQKLTMQTPKTSTINRGFRLYKGQILNLKKGVRKMIERPMNPEAWNELAEINKLLKQQKLEPIKYQPAGVQKLLQREFPDIGIENRLIEAKKGDWRTWHKDLKIDFGQTVVVNASNRAASYNGGGITGALNSYCKGTGQDGVTDWPGGVMNPTTEKIVPVGPDRLPLGTFFTSPIDFGKIYHARGPDNQQGEPVKPIQTLYLEMLEAALKDPKVTTIILPAISTEIFADPAKKITMTKEQFRRAAYMQMAIGIRKFKRANPRSTLKIILNNWQ